VADYVFPTVQRLMQIEQDLLPSLIADDPIFDVFPIEDDEDDVLRWEQLDNYKGLQQIRGLDGDPPKVQRTGAKSYLAQPGVFGEQATIDERELTKRRKFGSFETHMDVTDLVRMTQDFLIGRELDRMRYVGWTLATTGTISIQDKDGVTMYADTFPLQTFTAGVSWATLATATPLANLRAIKLLQRGHSVDFGSRAVLYVNQTTANNLMNNQNAADLFGRRGMYGATFNSLANDNAILLENGLPQIEVYDGGYYNDQGVFTLYIPNNTGVLVGMRPGGQPVGNYRRTFNAVNNGGGSYMKIQNETDEVPPRITVQRGHNGGPVVFFPSALVILNL
jgi:hypothetical protein